MGPTTERVNVRGRACRPRELLITMTSAIALRDPFQLHRTVALADVSYLVRMWDERYGAPHVAREIDRALAE